MIKIVFCPMCASVLTGIVDDEIFGLEVSVGNPLLVHVRQGVDDHSAVEVHVLGGKTFKDWGSTLVRIWA